MGATSIQELNGYVHRSVDVVLGLSNYILAALMVAFGAVQLIYAYTDEYTTLTWLLALSYIVMLVGGAVIILDRNRNLLRAVGIYALALGFYRFIFSFPSIEPGNPYGMVSIVVCALAINLMISGRSYLKGVSRGRRLAMISTFLLLMVYVTLFITLMHAGLGLVDCMKLMPGAFVMSIMYAFFIGILDSEELRSSDILAIHNDTLDKIRCIQYTDPRTSIPRETALVLAKVFEDRSDWHPVDDGGPAECEYRFVIENKGKGSEVLMQNGRGPNPSISPSPTIWTVPYSKPTGSKRIPSVRTATRRYAAGCVYSGRKASACSWRWTIPSTRGWGYEGAEDIRRRCTCGPHIGNGHAGGGTVLHLYGGSIVRS